MIKKLGMLSLALVVSAGMISGCGKSEKQAGSEPHSRGKLLSLSCTSCHGPDGKSVGVMPKIYGKEVAYIQEQMMKYKNGEGNPTVMDRIAKGYTDEEIKLIAEYFGNLKQGGAN
jgi:sulfide dehydrogenase cytochrome subunit